MLDITSAFSVIFLALYYMFVFAVSLATYLLQAFAIFKMAKNMGYNNPWLAFIPFANVYMFGKVAETYIKSDGRPSAKFSKILLTLQIILMAILVLLVVLIVMILFIEATGTYFLSPEIETLAASAMVLPLILAIFAMLGVAIAYAIINYVALWRIFALYNYKNATLFLVLTLFVGVLTPIFLFVLRNKEPMFTMEQRVKQQ